VNVRYMRDFRSDIGALSRVLVPASGGQRQIPLSQLAAVKVVSGPSMIRDEDGLLTGYVYVDGPAATRTAISKKQGGCSGKKSNFRRDTRSPGAASTKSMHRVKERLIVVVPFTLFLVLILLYLNTRSITKTLIVLLAVTFLRHRRLLVSLPARI